MRLSILRVIILILMAQGASVFAQDTGYHCAALDEGSTYKDKKSYKYLLMGDEGWMFRSKKDFKGDFLLDDETLHKFSDFDKALKKNGVTLHIVMPPTRGILHYKKLIEEQKFVPEFDPAHARSTYRQSLQQLKLTGISVTSFDNVFERQNDFYYKRDHHWTLAGAEFSAQKTAELFEPYREEIPAVTYKTERTDEKITLNGAFEKFVEKACDVNIAGEETAVVKTYKESDLFDREELPPIALVGTSNCTEPNPSYANFAGYLRQYVGADVDNISIAGGGIDTPILSYLASDDYQNKKHKHIIWELASHYDFNGKEFAPIFKQIIPAAKGLCGDEALIKKEFPLSAKKTSIITGAVQMPTYISLKFDAAIKKDFALNYKNEEGKSQRFRFQRSDRYPHDGIYFLDLGAEPISDLSLLMPKNHEAKSVSIEICPFN